MKFLEYGIFSTNVKIEMHIWVLKENLGFKRKYGYLKQYAITEIKINNVMSVIISTGFSL